MLRFVFNRKLCKLKKKSASLNFKKSELFPGNINFLRKINIY